MNEQIQRLIAILLLVVPGWIATYGFLVMKDAWFIQFDADGTGAFLWGKFLFGFLLFFLGIGFVGGWIFFRDRKRNYVAPRFRKKRSRPRPTETSMDQEKK